MKKLYFGDNLEILREMPDGGYPDVNGDSQYHRTAPQKLKYTANERRYPE